jgi:hypothetical protein
MYQPIFSVKTGWIVGKIISHTATPLTEEEIKEVCEKLNSKDQIRNDIIQECIDKLLSFDDLFGKDIIHELSELKRTGR